jgi:hypothetical protein
MLPNRTQTERISPLFQRWLSAGLARQERVLASASAEELTPAFFRAFFQNQRWESTHRALLDNPALSGEPARMACAEAANCIRAAVRHAVATEMPQIGRSPMSEFTEFLRRVVPLVGDEAWSKEFAEELAQLSLASVSLREEWNRAQHLLGGMLVGFPGLEKAREDALMSRFVGHARTIVHYGALEIENQQFAFAHAITHPDFPKELLLELLPHGDHFVLPELAMGVERWARDPDIAEALLPTAGSYVLECIARHTTGEILRRTLETMDRTRHRKLVEMLKELAPEHGLSPEDLLSLLRSKDADVRLAAMLASSRISEARAAAPAPTTASAPAVRRRKHQH